MYSTVQYSTVTVQYSYSTSTVQYSSVKYSKVKYSTVQYSTEYNILYRALLKFRVHTAEREFSQHFIVYSSHRVSKSPQPTAHSDLSQARFTGIKK